MKTILKISFILITVIIFIIPEANAQRDKSGNDNNNSSRYENYIEPGVIIISASLKKEGVYRINIDAGKDEEGRRRSIASNEREDKALMKILNMGSLSELLGILVTRGYEISSAYAVMETELTHYYVLSKQNNDADDNPKEDVVRKRTNQNRPKLSPEEIEQRKKMRERNNK